MVYQSPLEVSPQDDDLDDYSLDRRASNRLVDLDDVDGDGSDVLVDDEGLSYMEEVEMDEQKRALKSLEQNIVNLERSISSHRDLDVGKVRAEHGRRERAGDRDRLGRSKRCRSTPGGLPDLNDDGLCQDYQVDETSSAELVDAEMGPENVRKSFTLSLGRKQIRYCMKTSR